VRLLSPLELLCWKIFIFQIRIVKSCEMLW